MDVIAINEHLQIAAHVVTILSLPGAILIYYREKRRERLDREYGTYNALDDKYIDFLKLCAEHPELDIFEIPIGTDRKEPLAERQELILYTMLISILERAYLMYSDQCTEIKARQWNGWHDYALDYCRRTGFRNAWRKIGSGFDLEFCSYIDDLIANCRSSDSADASSVSV